MYDFRWIADSANTSKETCFMVENPIFITFI